MSYTIVKLQRGFTEIEQLFNAAKQLNLNICGGYARYCASLRVSPVPASDVDLFPITENDFEPAKNFFLNESLEVDFENDVSLLFKVPSDVNHKWRTTPKIQLIKPFEEAKIKTFGPPEEILNNFDFTIVRACILSPTEVLVDENFIEDELNTLISLRNIHCPISSMFRAIKYIRRGYFLPMVESIKLFQDWDSRTPEYKEKILNFIDKVDVYKNTGDKALSDKEFFEMERLMRID